MFETDVATTNTSSDTNGSHRRPVKVVTTPIPAAPCPQDPSVWFRYNQTIPCP